MNVLWMSACTTSLDPFVANVVEVAWCPQPHGSERRKIRKLKVQPLRHAEDQKYGKYPLEKWRQAYNAKHGKDPSKNLEEVNGSLVSMATLRYLNLTPEDLFTDAVTPTQFLEQLWEDSCNNFSENFTLASYGAGFLATLVSEYIERASPSHSKCFEERSKLVTVDLCNEAHFLRAMGVIKTPRLSLANVCKEFGIECGVGAESKLQATLALADLIVKGTSHASESTTSDQVSSQETGFGDRATVRRIHAQR